MNRPDRPIKQSRNSDHTVVMECSSLGMEIVLLAPGHYRARSLLSGEWIGRTRSSATEALLAMVYDDRSRRNDS